MSGKRLTLFLALAATLLAALLAPPRAGEGVVAPAERGDSPMRLNAAASSAAAVEVLAIRSRDAEPETTAPFPSPAPARKARRAEPVAAAVPAPEAQLAPQPPAPPFRVLGRYAEAGQEVVFLQHGEQNIVARAGDRLGAHYQLESISQGMVTLLFLPLGVRQTLDAGGAP